MKHKAAIIGMALAGTALWGASAVRVYSQAGPPPRTDVTIEAHVYEPVQQAASKQNVAQLTLPPGFRIAKFAENLGNPRMIAIAGDGTVYVSRRKTGDVVMLRDTNHDGRADQKKIVAVKPMLHGIALRGDTVYLATVKDVFVADRRRDGTLGPLKKIVADLPDGGQHPNRTLAFGPDGMLYVSVGSTCNACAETNPESATILRMRPDGSGREIYASGLRNTIGFGWHPRTNALYGMDHGIDWLGNDDQKEELNRIEKGARYGWPYIYADGKRNPQDDPKDKNFSMAQWDAMSRRPQLLYTAHSAPLQLAFYTGKQFPAAYKNDAFVALRGSWNRKPPSGYEVVRVRFDAQGKPARIEPFLSGFLIKRPDGEFDHFARLAGLAVAPDGALFVGDDTNGVIYRVSYKGF